MENKSFKLLPNMALMIVTTLISMLNFSHSIAQEVELEPQTDAIEQSNLGIYIVNLALPQGKVFAQSEGRENWYRSFLPITAANSNKEPRMVYSYHSVMTGFAAKLSPEEVKSMETKKGFVSARPQKRFSLHTTHTPNFLGLHQNMGLWKGSNLGKGVIVGVLDSGITPNHPSFSDEGMLPPPAKWKGKCDIMSTPCNNKLIGARNFLSGSTDPPLDLQGHGTHTASTAVGNFVKDASVLGNANGTAVGMAPLAHLAVYKICSEIDCLEADILAAMEAAIEDGVDVLSLSLGAGSHPFYEDSLSMGAFAAIQKGIFVSCSAGNAGPINASLSNEAPWILTVGASTIDRSITTTAKLGNGEEFDGQSLFQPHDFPPTLLPLVYPGSDGHASAFCGPGSLNKYDVKGKVVVCVKGGDITRVAKGKTVKDAGGAAMIVINADFDAYSTSADAHVLPATHVSFADGLSIKSYIKSTSTPTATILFKGTVIGAKNAPMVSSFSSRGPNLASPGILKPDIIGPGVSILAAWPFSLDNTTTDTQLTFNMISGTSMSCPHLSGIAALLKSAHPDWSPAAIKSAIMTTADWLNLNNTPIKDETLLPADVFATGSGHVNPTRANDPGLVYDIKPDDYIPYLCGLGYSDQQVSTVIQRTVKCSKESSIQDSQLNYPSFAIQLGSSDLTYTRTATNVGDANSSYDLQIILPPGVDVSVKPDRLDFTEMNQKMTYQVRFHRSNASVEAPFVEGFLQWVSAKQFVRSPISVKLV